MIGKPQTDQYTPYSAKMANWCTPLLPAGCSLGSRLMIEYDPFDGVLISVIVTYVTMHLVEHFISNPAAWSDHRRRK